MPRDVPAKGRSHLLGCPKQSRPTRSVFLAPLPAAALTPKSKPIKAKAKCCKDKPRCKRCPVVLKRLSDDGYLERLDKRTYVVVDIVPKAAMKAARKRG